MAAGGAATGTVEKSASVGITFTILPQIGIDLAQTRRDVLAIAAEAWLRCEGGYAEATEPPGLLRLKESKTERGAFEFVFVIRKGGRRPFSNPNRQDLQLSLERYLERVLGVLGTEVSGVRVEAIERLTDKGFQDKWDQVDAGPGNDAKHCCGSGEDGVSICNPSDHTKPLLPKKYHTCPVLDCNGACNTDCGGKTWWVLDMRKSVTQVLTARPLATRPSPPPAPSSEVCLFLDRTVPWAVHVVTWLTLSFCHLIDPVVT